MSKTVNEYAVALFTLAKEKGAENEIQNGLLLMTDAFRSEPEYADLLVSPAIPVSERLELLQRAFGNAVHEYALSCVMLMCEHGVIEHYTEMAEEYGKLLEHFTRSTTAIVTSAVPLTENEKNRLRAKLSEMSGNDIRLECSVDASLIGGVRVEIDGTVLDGSVKRRLDKAKEVIDI